MEFSRAMLVSGRVPVVVFRYLSLGNDFGRFLGWLPKYWLSSRLHPRKLTWIPQNDGLEMVTPFKYSHVWYPC